MRSAGIIGPSPGSFYLVPGDEMYFTERLSWVLLKNLERLSTTGFVFSQTEASDVTSALDTADTFVSEFDAWMSQSVAFAADGDDGSLVPFDGGVIRAIVTAIAAAFSGGSAMVAILIEIGIRLVIKWVENQFTSDPSDQISRTLEALFREEGTQQSLADILHTSLIWNDAGNLKSFFEKVFQETESGKSIADLFRYYGLDTDPGGSFVSMLERILNEVYIKYEPRAQKVLISFGQAFEE